MSKKRFVWKALLSAAAIAFASMGQTATARDWHPSPASLALNYSQIVDSSDKRVVFVWWIAAPAFNEPSLTPILEKYFVLGVVKAHFDETVDIQFEDVPAPVVTGADGKALKLSKEDDQAPGVVAVVAAFKSILVKMIGPMGKGMKLFVYEPGGINACKPGKVSVQTADETYTYDTPMPGCPKP